MNAPQPLSAARAAGIIPATNGAVAILDPDGSIVRTAAMPICERAGKTIIDARALSRLLETSFVEQVFLSRVLLPTCLHPPKIFATAVSVGIVEATLTIAGIPFCTLYADDWRAFATQFEPGSSRLVMARAAWPVGPFFTTSARAEASLTALASLQGAERRRMLTSGPQTSHNAALVAA